MKNPYWKYPKGWEKFSLEQCEEMEREVKARTRQLQEEPKEEKMAKSAAQYYGLVPIAVILFVFAETGSKGFLNVAFELLGGYLISVIAFVLGREYYGTLLEKVRAKTKGANAVIETLKFVVLFAVSFVLIHAII